MEMCSFFGPPCIVYARRQFDIVGAMLYKLEKYADNMESIIQGRTEEIIEKKTGNGHASQPHATTVCFMSFNLLYSCLRILFH